MTVRTALVALLLFVPALIIIRETQRAGVRGTAVQLSKRQYPTPGARIRADLPGGHVESDAADQ